MAYASIAGRARTNALSPQAHAICDRCGFRYNRVDLQYQFEWAGNAMQNLRRAVCRTCLDVPQDQNRAIIVPADPMPINDPRPEFFVQDEGSIANPYSVTGYPSEILYLCQMAETGYPVSLPTSLPTEAGVYWVNNGVLCVTLGGNNPLPLVKPSTPGTFWNNNGVVCITDGGDFPLSIAKPFSPGLFWSDGGVVCISQ